MYMQRDLEVFMVGRGAFSRNAATFVVCPCRGGGRLSVPQACIVYVQGTGRMGRSMASACTALCASRTGAASPPAPATMASLQVVLAIAHASCLTAAGAMMRALYLLTTWPCIDGPGEGRYPQPPCTTQASCSGAGMEACLYRCIFLCMQRRRQSVEKRH